MERNRGFTYIGKLIGSKSNFVPVNLSNPGCDHSRKCICGGLAQAWHKLLNKRLEKRLKRAVFEVCHDDSSNLSSWSGRGSASDAAPAFLASHLLPRISVT